MRYKNNGVNLLDILLVSVWVYVDLFLYQFV